MFYIDNTEELIAICKEILEKSSNIIAVDTEFTKHTEYFPEISIIQISFFNGEIMKDCIIDLLSSDLDVSPLKEIFLDNKIKKIFHSCSQDLEGLYKIFGEIPSNIEDIQIMACFCGMKANLSYKELIKDSLGVIIKKSKELQASDWKRRPLSDEQLNYAGTDVEYLLEIYIKLSQKIGNNFKYYRREIEERYNKKMIEKIVDTSWKKVRFQLGNKTNIFMFVVKELCKVREKLAIRNNIVRSGIFPDSIFKPLIVNRPSNLEEFDELFKDNKEIINKPKILKRTIINTYNKTFNKIINDKIEEKPYIVELKDKQTLSKLNEINDYIISECKKMNINPEIVQNKLDLISYITDSEELEKLFLPWKMEVFGERIKYIKNK